MRGLTVERKGETSNAARGNLAMVDARGSPKQHIGQAPLFTSNSMPPLHTIVISRRQNFENLFEGFTKLWAISYVVSPDLLLEFLDRRGYTEVEVLVGENLSKQYQQDLERKGIEVTERLLERMEDNTLRIFIPRERIIHTKLYILEGHGSVRVIVSSANFTETARQASRQINYAWYADLAMDNSLLLKIRQDYQSHLKDCFPFMGDLRELLRKHEDLDRLQVIEAWLKGTSIDEENLEVKRVLQEISLNALQSSNSREESLIVVQLPKTPAAKRQIGKFLEPAQPSMTHNELRLNNSTFIHYVEKNHGFPLMRVDLEREETQLGINGSVLSLSEAIPDSILVNQGLQHIENYLDTVDFGQSPDSKFAKTSMFEALLYMFFAPFANEHMKNMRGRYGIIDRRGPRFLYIYGPSQNGKSTFLRFALKLLTGHMIQPLSGKDFIKERILTATDIGTVFPLVFDDISQGMIFQNVIKSYWEVWWKQGYVSPQIIMTSNSSRLHEWAKSRVKRVDFDVQFAPNESSKEKLAKLFSEENLIFRWFSYLYLKRLKNSELLSDDELQLARAVMRELYEHAKRPLPEFFPLEPIERLYDPGRRIWRDLLYQLKKAKSIPEKGRMLMEFSGDMQPREIGEYQAYLPQTVKSQRRGNTLIIETPDEFKEWLEGQSPQRRSWLTRLFGK